MFRRWFISVAALVSLGIPAARAAGQAVPAGSIRVATFNASLNRESSGKLLADLRAGTDPQIRNVAEIIQRTRPDVLLVNEFDHDPEGRGVDLFEANYLARPQGGAEPIRYPYRYTGEVNTGVPSGADLDNDGKIAAEPGSRGYGNDAFGYGVFPGQYGMAIYSKFPIRADRVRAFGQLRWADVPGATLPKRPDGSSFYSPAAVERFRLSSKNHWDVPIGLPEGRTLHLLVSHPTPPSFDGPEDRNGLRNRDEIRLWSDYLAGGDRAGYLKSPGLDPSASFVILGDQNADPADGGSVPGAIDQLLKHPRVDASFVPSSAGAREASALQGGANARQVGPPDQDTADFDDRSVGNLRADYVLPSMGIKVSGGGVFWPEAADPLHRLVEMTPTAASSDHRLVYLDLIIPKDAETP